ncbi:MAG: ankyrin repeat domain-containing protein [Myxococcota bacterium]
MSARRAGAALLLLTLALGSAPDVRAQAGAPTSNRRDVPAASAAPLLREAEKAIRLRDPKRAVALWERAAGMGDPEAEYRLGNAYRSGVGVDKDDAKAAEWYRRAADKRHADAQFALGSLYQYGRGVPADRDRALRLFGAAAKAGHAEAKRRLATFGETGSIVVASGSARLAAAATDPVHALAQAVRDTDLGAAREALARGAAVDGPLDASYPMPLLVEAVRRDAREIVSLLLAHHADPNAALPTGETVLVHAVREASPTVVQALLRAGARPDARLPGGSTALHEAARLGRIDVASDLLAGGASAAVVTNEGVSAAEIARRFGHARLASLLRQKGAPSPRTGADMALRGGTDAPARAAREAKPGELPPVVEAGRRGDVELIRKLLAAGSAVDVVDPDGDRALGRAAEGGHADAVRLLLASGAAVDMADGQGRTPLLRAAAARGTGADAAFAALLAAGADPNARDRRNRGIAYHLAESATPGKVEALQSRAVQADSGDLTEAITRAAVAERPESLKALLALSGDPRLRTPALCGALAGGRTEAIETLLAHGADANATCEDGGRPLIAAARGGDETLVRRLLAAGADASAASRAGDTALIAAASRGHVEVVQRLLEAGAPVDQRGEHKLTALMAGAANGHVEVVDRLLRAGANARNRDDAAQRATDLARAAGHDAVVERLRGGSESSWGAWMGSSERP